MKIRIMVFLLGLGLGIGQGCFVDATVNTAAAALKPAIPAIGTQYSLGQLWSLINTSNPAKTSNFILATMNGQPIRHEACWPAQGAFLDGSVSADHVNFGGVAINASWIQANQGVMVQLQTDPIEPSSNLPRLVDYLVKHNRISKTDGNQYAQVLLYFVLNIGGANYRFYLNDPFPGGIQGKVNPARMIIGKWDFTRSYRP